MKDKMNEFRQKWENLDANDKRKYIIGAIVFVVICLAVVLSDSRKADRVAQGTVQADSKVEKTSIVAPATKDVSLDDLRGQAQAEIDKDRQQREEQQRTLKEFRDATDAKTEGLKSQNTELAQNVAQLAEELRVMRMGQGDSSVNKVGGVSLPPLNGIDAITTPQAGAGTDPKFNAEAIQAVGMTPNTDAPLSQPDQLIHPQEKPESGLKVVKKGNSGNNVQGSAPNLSANRNGVIDKNKSAELNKQSLRQRILDSHLLTTGSMIEGVLVSGMDAASGRGQSSPVPALIRVKKNAILPNRYAQDIRECFILVSGVGDLARERANMRTEKISCIFKDGYVVDTAISGYVVGEDGKAGMRGRVVSKQGAILARSVFASFLEGFGSALKPSSVNALDISGSSEAKMRRQNMGDAFEQGSYDGVSDGFSKVADYYLDLAEQMFPIIEIDAGRKATIILTDRLSIQKQTIEEFSQKGKK